MFVDSIDSLFRTCHSADNFEVLVATDNDDADTTEKLKEYALDKPNIRFFSYDRKFYHGINLYYNDLCEKSLGRSLAVWNDDFIMESKDWDLRILEYHKKFCVLSPKISNQEKYWATKGVLLPIIPKKWIEITGCLSPHFSCDSWIDVLAKEFKLLLNTPDIIFFNDCHNVTGKNNDESYQESRKVLLDTKYTDDKKPLEMKVHRQKLHQYIEQNRNDIPVYNWP